MLDEQITKIDNSEKELCTLLIDNGTETLTNYLTLLTKHQIHKVFFSDIQNLDLSKYKLIILTDGRCINISQNTHELDLVRKTSIPVIGICYGFQILCHAYGAKLEALEEKRTGILEIKALTRHTIFQDKNTFYVTEKHKYGVKSVPDSIECLAESKDGYEIIKIKDKQQFGLQFHPELTELSDDGEKIFNNLVDFIFNKNKQD